LLFGFGGSLLLTLGFGGTGAANEARSRADTSTADRTDKASFRDAFGPFGQIGFASKASDGALAKRFAKDFACGTARCRLPDAARSTADETLGNAVGNAGRDLVAESARKSLFDVAVLDAPDDRADGNGEAASELWINAFCGKTLKEFVDAASKKATASADTGARCRTGCCARKAADCADGCAKARTG
jgi:hypothetical protein